MGMLVCMGLLLIHHRNVLRYRWSGLFFTGRIKIVVIEKRCRLFLLYFRLVVAGFSAVLAGAEGPFLLIFGMLMFGWLIGGLVGGGSVLVNDLVDQLLLFQGIEFRDIQIFCNVPELPNKLGV